MAVDPPTTGEHLDEDRCLDLVHGLLDESARRAAYEHAAGCVDCDRMLREVTASYERGRARVGAALAERPVAAIPRRRRSAPWLAAAALALVGFAGWLATRPVDAPYLRMQSATLVGLSPRRGGAPIDSLTMAGLRAYDRAENLEAERLLEAGRPDERAVERLRRVYLGNARLALGDARGALEALSVVRPEMVPEPWHSEMLWTRMVALYRLGERSRGDSLLEVLADNPGPLAARARGLRPPWLRRR